MKSKGLDPQDMNKLIQNGGLLGNESGDTKSTKTGKKEIEIVHDLLYDGKEESEYEKAPKYFLPGITPHTALKPIQLKYYHNFIDQLFTKSLPLDIVKEWYDMPLHPIIGHVRCTIKRRR